MRILHISEQYPPYIRGGGELSASIINDYLSVSNEVTVVSAQHRNKSWKFSKINVHPILKILIPELKSASSIYTYAILSSFIYPYLNAIKILKFLLSNKHFDIVQVELNSYLQLPLLLVLRVLNQNIVISIRDGNLLCPNGYSKGTCLNSDLKLHSCFKEMMDSTDIWSYHLEILRGLYVVPKFLNHKFFRALFRQLVNTYSKVIIITTSGFLKNCYTTFRISKNKIVVVANPIQELGKDKLNVKRDRNKFVFAGRLEPEKGIFVLLDAFELLAQKYPNVSLCIIGGGSSESILKEKISSNKLNVLFTGRLNYEEVLESYARARAIVAPSLWPEPFGRFILDSISTKTPLITSDSGGPSTLIDHKINGIKLKQVTPQAMFLSMEEILIDDDLWRRISENLEYKKTEYSIELLANKRLAEFRKLVTNSNDR